MKVAIVLAAAAAFALPLASGAQEKNGVVTIVMPGDLGSSYKSGPGQTVAQTYCLTCHSAGYVAMQPPMDAQHWAKTVTKMRKQYGMQMPDADAKKIAAYLGASYGPTKR